MASWTVLASLVDRRVMVYPRHTLALMQGGIVLACCLALSLAQMDLNDVYSRVGRAATWTRLHTLFLVFAALDTLMEQLGQRVTGYLSWCVSHRERRTVILFTTWLSVFLHCLVLNLQVSTLHQAIDMGNEILSLLVTVKFTATDLKAGLRLTNLSSEDVLKSCASDIVARFKWLILLGMILIFKVSSFISHYIDVVDPSETWEPFVYSSPLCWFNWVSWMVRASLRCVFGTLPSPYSLTSPVPTSSFLQQATMPPTSATFGGGPMTVNWSGVTSLAMTMLICYASAVIIDWIKHAFLILMNSDHLDANVYKSFRQKFGAEFSTAPKLGLVRV